MPHVLESMPGPSTQGFGGFSFQHVRSLRLLSGLLQLGHVVAEVTVQSHVLQPADYVLSAGFGYTITLQGCRGHVPHLACLTMS